MMPIAAGIKVPATVASPPVNASRARCMTYGTSNRKTVPPAIATTLAAYRPRYPELNAQSVRVASGFKLFASTRWLDSVSAPLPIFYSET